MSARRRPERLESDQWWRYVPWTTWMVLVVTIAGVTLSVLAARAS